jgi:hypothetical protein
MGTEERLDVTSDIGSRFGIAQSYSAEGTPKDDPVAAV